jgi:hypothetical protein
VSCCCENLVAEAGDSSRTQRKGNIRYWKPLPSNGSEDVTMDTSIFVCIKESSKSVINPKPVYSHTHTRDNFLII